MFIAHAPAGYIVAAIVDRAVSREKRETDIVILSGILFSVIPDIDMIYFYTIDNRQHLHHSYWTHIPVFWLACSLSLLITSQIFKTRKVFLCSLMLFLATTLHLALDSVVGGIHWLYPIESTAFTLITVPAQHGHWILNFILHWTFLVELGLILLACIVLFFRTRLQERPANG